jgi:hypothetical protein
MYLQKLQLSLLFKKFPEFLKPQGSLPCYKEPDTCPILNYMSPIHTLPPSSFKTILILFYSLRLNPSSLLFSSLLKPCMNFFSHQTCHRAPNFFLLDLIIVVTFGQTYKAISPSLCNSILLLILSI